MAVPIQSPPPPSYEEETLIRMEAERKMMADEKFSGWAIVWTLFAFKLATIAVVIFVARNTRHSGSEEQWAYIITTTWYWFIIPIVAISGFVTWRLRLRKARKRAQEMKRSEFEIPVNSGTLSNEEKDRLRRLRYMAENDR